jgi:hypothetical protein
MLFIDTETGVWSGGYPEEAVFASTQYAGGAHATWTLGAHALKGGVEYEDNKLDADARFEALVRFSPVTYLEFLRVIDGAVHNRVPSVFVRDSWRITEWLRLNAGLRWDGQFLIASDGGVAQKITDQYQPRLNVIYLPGELGTHKVTASFGRFYQELPTLLSTLYHTEGSLQRQTIYDHDPRVDPTGGFVIGQTDEVQAEVEDLEGQHYDEFALGYEQLLDRGFKGGVRGIYRTLRQGIEDAEISPGSSEFRYGNPGSGALSDYPEVDRDYYALELTVVRSGDEKINCMASYVLSRTEGNYPGLFNSDFNFAWPNANASFDYLENVAYGNGLLPNDRTHVVKLSGSYRFDRGLTVGTWLSWMSGTPQSEFGGSSIGPPSFNFISKRGTAGRTPSIWDVNLRVVYDLSRATRTTWRQRLILDVFHLGSRREPVAFDQVRYYGPLVNGNQTSPNPFYGHAIKYQPPMSMRLGLEIEF